LGGGLNVRKLDTKLRLSNTGETHPFIYYTNRTQSTETRKKEKRKIGEQPTRAQIIRNVRKVTTGERVRQTYQPVSYHCHIVL